MNFLGFLGITFTPKEPGRHILSVTKHGKHLTNSPFTIMVDGMKKETPEVEYGDFQCRKSNLHYTRGIKPKCATSGEAHLRGIASKLPNSEGGEPLTILRPIRPSREPNSELTAPIAVLPKSKLPVIFNIYPHISFSETNQLLSLVERKL